VTGQELLVVSGTPSVSASKENAQKLPTGQLDGIVRTSDGSLLISSWEGSSILRGMPGSTFAATIIGVAAPADIAYDSKRGRLWIPLFTGDAIEIHALASLPAGSPAP
jgi:hypothetical protein